PDIFKFNKMAEHAVSLCPRCGSNMICKVGNITQCDCFTVQVSAETREFLSKTDFACVCVNCLNDLELKQQLIKRFPFPSKKHEFIENVHYYIDGEKWVFTELYHISRGYCCGNSCRH